MVNRKFHARIKVQSAAICQALIIQINCSLLDIVYVQFLSAKFNCRFIHHRSNASHNQKVRLNFKVVEGGINVV